MYQPFQNAGAVALAGVIALLMLAVACSAPVSAPTPEPLPTYTPYPTYTPFPTLTTAPMSAPLPTYTPYPTYTPFPTPTTAPMPTSLPTYTPYPTYTPFPTPTTAPTATPVPTPTPEPTATPVPTPTPTPEPAPPAGIGVTREAVESRFVKAGFTFDESWLNDGRYRTIASQGDILVELIGPSENLSQATLVLDLPSTLTEYNRNEFLTVIPAMLAFLDEVFPESTDAADWLSKAMGELGGEGDRSTTYGDKRLRVSDGRDSIGFFFIFVEPNDS